MKLNETKEYNRIASYIIRDEVPPAAYDFPVDGLNAYDITIYVPAGAKEAYSKAPGWSWFPYIVEEGHNGIISIKADQQATAPATYDFFGRKLHCDPGCERYFMKDNRRFSPF